MDLELYNKGKQPCKELKPFKGEWFRSPSYKCRFCGSRLVFCLKCGKTHHKNGWQTCQYDY